MEDVFDGRLEKYLRTYAIDDMRKALIKGINAFNELHINNPELLVAFWRYFTNKCSHMVLSKGIIEAYTKFYGELENQHPREKKERTLQDVARGTGEERPTLVKTSRRGYELKPHPNVGTRREMMEYGELFDECYLEKYKGIKCPPDSPYNTGLLPLMEASKRIRLASNKKDEIVFFGGTVGISLFILFLMFLSYIMNRFEKGAMDEEVEEARRKTLKRYGITPKKKRGGKSRASKKKRKTQGRNKKSSKAEYL